jgi:CRISPR-associated protein Cas2
MGMTVVITRNVPDRYRGFLASCMLEIAPGVYSSPRMTKAVRERVWMVCCEWAGLLPSDGGIVLTWRDAREPGGQGLRLLGWPKQHFAEYDGTWLVRRGLPSATATDEPTKSNPAEGPPDL